MSDIKSSPDPKKPQPLDILVRELTRTREEQIARRAQNQFLVHRQKTYGDQKGQVDFFVNNVMDYENNGLPRSGFFVDLACADGGEINNTYFLERWCGWRGILFEANPGYHDHIRASRTMPLVSDVVFDRAGQTVPFRIDNGMLGGVVSDETDNNAKTRPEEMQSADIVRLPTTTLEIALDDHDAPRLIDFMSLDVEGAEYIILRGFDFDKYKFRCMAIERPTPELDLLLDAQGYRQVQHLSYDVIYVHADFVAEVNFAPRARFAFTPGKDW